MNERDHFYRPLVIALAAGMTMRLILVATTLGTSDILYWRLWYSLIDEHGILSAYRFHSELNHPPLSLLILFGLGRIADALGILVSEPLRVLQTLADGVTAFSLLEISRRSGIDRPATASMFFLLSPIAILISGFHGNSDSLMMALVCVAVLAVVQTRTPGWIGGLVLASAVGIKIVPLVLVPFFWSAIRGRRRSFSVAFFAGVAAIFVPGLWVSGSAFVRNVFGYSPTSMKWGLAGILAESGRMSLISIVEVWHRIGSAAIALSILALWAVSLRRISSERLPSYIALALLLFLAIAPGAGLRYLIWPLPFIPYLFGTRSSLVFHIVGSVGLAVIYTIWSRGFPWFFATPINSPPFEWLVPWVGLVVWSMVVAFAVVGSRTILGYGVANTVNATEGTRDL